MHCLDYLGISYAIIIKRDLKATYINKLTQFDNMYYKINCNIQIHFIKQGKKKLYYLIANKKGWKSERKISVSGCQIFIMLQCLIKRLECIKKS